MRKSLLLVLALLAVPSAQKGQAQFQARLEAAPVLALDDPASVQRLLEAALVLPPERPERVLLYDILQDGFGAGDVLVVLPERSVHVIDVLPEAVQQELRRHQRNNVVINLEYGRAGTLSPLAAFAESFDQLVRAYYDGQSLAATIIWRPDRAQVTVWGTDLERMKMTTWEEIASAGGVAYPVTFRTRGRREGMVRMWYDGTECNFVLSVNQRMVRRPCEPSEF